MLQLPTDLERNKLLFFFNLFSKVNICKPLNWKRESFIFQIIGKHRDALLTCAYSKVDDHSFWQDGSEVTSADIHVAFYFFLFIKLEH